MIYISRTTSSVTSSIPTSRSTLGEGARAVARSAFGPRLSAAIVTAPGAWPAWSTRSPQPRPRFPQVKEFFFDDDTFTDDLPRAEEIAEGLGRLGVTWSCNAKANVPRKTLEKLKAGGLRLLLVGYESGDQQILHNIKKGMRIEVAEAFTRDCHELGIQIHGTFIVGLPGETLETLEKTKEWARKINPHTIQVSLAAPYPGTFLYDQAVENGWLDASNAELVNDKGV